MAVRDGVSRNTYREAWATYHIAAGRSLEFSHGLSGTDATHGRQVISSLLFAKIAITAQSILKIAPTATIKEEVWDFASIASLIRDLAEARIVHYHLCIDKHEDENEWDYRQLLLLVRDNRARSRLFEHNPESDHEGRDAELKELETALMATRFATLPERQRRDLLKGEKAPYIQDEVIELMGGDPKAFRHYYRYLSAFVHTGPISFFRAIKHGRGDGSENDYDRTMIAGALLFGADLLTDMIRDMLLIHEEPPKLDVSAPQIGNRAQRRAARTSRKRR